MAWLELPLTALYFAAHPKQLDYIIQLRRHLPLRI